MVTARRLRPPMSFMTWIPSQANHPAVPVIATSPGATTIAARRPIVAASPRLV